MKNISESNIRLFEKIYQDFGPQIISLLEDKNVNEIMVNPDGSLFIDLLMDGLCFIQKIPLHQTKTIINSIAGFHNYVVNHSNPYLEAELPFYKVMKGERFTAQISPVVSSASFSIRKKSETIFTLENYLESQRLTLKQLNILKELISNRKNILIGGGPGSGKTTFTNALIQEAVIFNSDLRFVILEDLPELQCVAKNKLSLLTSNNVDMKALLRLAMRMRPDRILIGEVRGKEALDMLKAWNTGCPGGIATVHANGCEEAIQRICDLAMEAGLNNPPHKLIAHTIDAVISVKREGSKKGVIEEIIHLGEYQNEQFQIYKLD